METPPDPTSRRGSAARGPALAAVLLGSFSVITGCAYGFGIVPALAAVFCARLARRRMEEEGTREGSGMAKAGLILGVSGMVISLFFFALFVVMVVFGIGPGEFPSGPG